MTFLTTFTTAFIPVLAFLLLGILYARALSKRGTLEVTRRSIILTVLEFLLPILILDVFSRFSLHHDLPVLGITWLFSVGIMSLNGLLCAAVYTWIFKQPVQTIIPLILGSAFCNATYLGVPLIRSLLGEDVTFIAFAYDLTVMTPTLLTLGVWICTKFSPKKSGAEPLNILRPPLATFAAACLVLVPILSFTTLTLPAPFVNFLKLGSAAVAPLMLIAVGLLLELKPSKNQKPAPLPPLWPAIFLKLVFAPAFTYSLLKFGPDFLVILPAAVKNTLLIEAALPSMILPILLTESFGFDRQTHARLITATTLLSLVTLPLWISVWF